VSNWLMEMTEPRSFRDVPLGLAWVPLASHQTSPVPPLKRDAAVWPTEETGFARSRIVEAIRSAEDTVCICSFLFYDEAIRNALLDATGRGVRCYLLTMSEQHLLKDLSQESGFARKQVEEHKATLDALAGRVLVRTAQHFHSKFVVVDPQSPDKRVAFLSTANLAADALTRNVEVVVPLKGNLAEAIFEQFRIGFWQQSEHELFQPGRLEPVGKSGKRKLASDFPPEFLLTTQSSQTLKQSLLDFVENMQDDLWVSSYNLDMKHEVAQNMLRRVKGGLKTHVFVRPRVKNMEAAVALMRAGAEVYAHKFLHAKALLGKVGGKTHGIVMTANVESPGLDTGFETGILLSPSQCEGLRTLMESWPQTFHFRLAENLSRGQVEGQCLLWNGKELREAKVGGKMEKDLGSVQAKSINLMAETKPAVFPEPDGGEVLSLPHEIVYRWTVLPPTLPKGAQRLKSEGNINLFQHKEKKYVTVKSPEDVERVAPKAKELGAEMVAESSSLEPSGSD